MKIWPCYFSFKGPLRRSSVQYCVSLKIGTYILIFIQNILRSYSQGIFLLHITIYIYLDTTIYIYSHIHEEEYVSINTFMYKIYMHSNTSHPLQHRHKSSKLSSGPIFLFLLIHSCTKIYKHSNTVMSSSATSS